MSRTASLVVSFWLLAGCAGGPDPQVQLEDRDLARAMRLARVAFDSGNYQQATALYRDAAARGEARDDAWAIADAHYGAGASLLRQREEIAALEAVEAGREALALVEAQPFAELELLEATLRYRLGQAGAGVGAGGAVASGPGSRYRRPGHRAGRPGRLRLGGCRSASSGSGGTAGVAGTCAGRGRSRAGREAVPPPGPTRGGGGSLPTGSRFAPG